MSQERRTSISAFTQEESWTVSSKASENHTYFGPLEKLSSGSGFGSRKRWQQKYFYLQDRFGYADDRETSVLTKWIEVLDIEYPVQRPLDREFAVLRKSERPTDYYYVRFEEAGSKPKKLARKDIRPVTEQPIDLSARIPAGTRVLAPQKKVKAGWGRGTTQNLAVVLHGEKYEPLRMRAADAETANLWVDKINKRIEQEIETAGSSGGGAVTAVGANSQDALRKARRASALTQEAYVAGVAYQMAVGGELSAGGELGELARRGQGVAQHGGGSTGAGGERDRVRRISAQAEEAYNNEVRRLSGHGGSLAEALAPALEEMAAASSASASSVAAPPVPPAPAERRPSHNLNARVAQLEQKVLGKDSDPSVGLPARLAEIERSVYGESKELGTDTLIARVSTLEKDYFG